MDKIVQLRSLLQKHNLDGYIVPMNDEFNCEYVPASARRLEYLSGFSGSAATILVLQDKVIFFTDGRYELQAASELDTSFEIFISPQVTLDNYLSGAISNKKIGFDEKLISKKQLTKFAAISEKNNIQFIGTQTNLVDEGWKNRPLEKANKAFIHELKYSGKSKLEKIAEVKASLVADYCLITLPESVCWLLNIRGNDLPHTPFLLSYALINKNGNVVLYTDKNKISDELLNYFGDEVIVKDLEEPKNCLSKIKGKTIQLDPSYSSSYFYNLCKQNDLKIIEAADPCLKPKACKNPVELENIRQAHIQDAASLCRFFNWFKNNLGKTEITEISLSDKLEEIRKLNSEFFSLSFDTIAGFASNGAIIHYHANEKSNKVISGDSLLLLDSGAQYLNGTTDITRTIAIGKPTDEQIRNFTLVLQGHIALASAKFPIGTSGAQLDILARKALWAEGKDFAHGTGHGVGYFLNVHEGPQGISKLNSTPLEKGMVISNEPGFYKNNEYGIRIENLIAVKESEKNFLEFETLTLVPMDLKLIDINLLSSQEKNWLNNYHKNIFEKISPLLNEEEVKWLKLATKEI